MELTKQEILTIIAGRITKSRQLKLDRQTGSLSTKRGYARLHEIAQYTSLAESTIRDNLRTINNVWFIDLILSGIVKPSLPKPDHSFYLVRWTHPTTGHSFLKIGITKHSVLKRISQQQRGTEYLPTTLLDIRSSGSHVVALEAHLKSILKVGHVSKEVFSDGHSETLYDCPVMERMITEMATQSLS